jgi:hypothetical protein
MQQQQQQQQRRDWLTLWQSSDDARKIISVTARGKTIDERRRAIIVRYPLSMVQSGDGDGDGDGYGYQAFYESSGANAKQGIWYPFDGITASIGQSRDWITKVIFTSFAARYDVQSPYKRFGCCFFMFLSSLLSDHSGIIDTSKLKEADLRQWNHYSRMRGVLVRHKISYAPALDESRDINLFVGKALSYNYLKGVEYKAGFHGTKVMDYRKIYAGEKYPFFTGNPYVRMERPMLTRCGDGTEFIADFMLSMDHTNTSFMSFFSYLPKTTCSYLEKRMCDMMKSGTAFQDGASLFSNLKISAATTATTPATTATTPATTATTPAKRKRPQQAPVETPRRSARLRK